MTDDAAEPARRAASARRILGAAAVLSVAGVLVAGTVQQTVGGVVAIGGWLLLVAGLHLFGRAGT